MLAAQMSPIIVTKAVAEFQWGLPRGACPALASCYRRNEDFQLENDSLQEDNREVTLVVLITKEP